jgi:hypothetical protein
MNTNTTKTVVFKERMERLESIFYGLSERYKSIVLSLLSRTINKAKVFHKKSYRRSV